MLYSKKRHLVDAANVVETADIVSDKIATMVRERHDPERKLVIQVGEYHNYAVNAAFQMALGNALEQRLGCTTLGYEFPDNVDMPPRDIPADDNFLSRLLEWGREYTLCTYALLCHTRARGRQIIFLDAARDTDSKDKLVYDGNLDPDFLADLRKKPFFDGVLSEFAYPRYENHRCDSQNGMLHRDLHQLMMLEKSDANIIMAVTGSAHIVYAPNPAHPTLATMIAENGHDIVTVTLAETDDTEYRMNIARAQSRTLSKTARQNRLADFFVESPPLLMWNGTTSHSEARARTLDHIFKCNNQGATILQPGRRGYVYGGLGDPNEVYTAS